MDSALRAIFWRMDRAAMSPCSAPFARHLRATNRSEHTIARMRSA
jgi:hypothetical protein